MLYYITSPDWGSILFLIQCPKINLYNWLAQCLFDFNAKCESGQRALTRTFLFPSLLNILLSDFQLDDFRKSKKTTADFTIGQPCLNFLLHNHLILLIIQRWIRTQDNSETILSRLQQIAF